MSRTALYAGSFDPVTNGHVDVLRGACRVAEKVVVAIGVHPGKAPLFTPEERGEMLHEVMQPITEATGTAFDVITFSDLAVKAAERAGATLFVRGLRDGTDLDYEMQIAGMNSIMAPGIQTVFLPASMQVRPITATLVRQIAAMGGDVTPFVPASVARRLAVKYGR